MAQELLWLFRMKQLRFPEKKYGGRKTARAISLRGANHITLRANAFVLRRNHRLVKQLIHETQMRYGLRLKAFAIMSNHIHLAAKVPSRRAFGNAMRFLASRIALRIGKGKLWMRRVWSRPVASRRDLNAVTSYIARNTFRVGAYDEKVDSFAVLDGMLRLEVSLLTAAPDEQMCLQI